MCTENMYDIFEDLTVTIHESDQLYDPKPCWTFVNLSLKVKHQNTGFSHIDPDLGTLNHIRLIRLCVNLRALYRV